MEQETDKFADESGTVFSAQVVRAAFREAATFFVETVARIPADAWEKPGLGDWSIRALVGHTSRSFLTVESYLDAGAAEIVLTSSAATMCGRSRPVLTTQPSPSADARRAPLSALIPSLPCKPSMHVC